MADKKEKLEDIYRKQFDDFQPPVSPMVWENISEEMGFKKKKRRGLFIWFLNGLLILLAAAALCAYWCLPVTPLRKDNITLRNEAAKENSPSTSAEKAIEVVPGNEAVKDQSITVTIEKDATSPASSQMHTSAGQSLSTQLQGSSASSSAKEKLNGKLQSTTASSTSTTASIPVNDLHEQNSSEGVAASSFTAEAATGTPPADTTAENTSIVATAATGDSIDQANAPAAVTTRDTLKIADSTNNVNAEITSAPQDNKGRISYYAGLDAGPAYTYRTFTGYSNETLSHLDKSEKPGIAYTIGAIAGMCINKRFHINTGIGINKYASSYLYEHTTTDYHTVMVIDSIDTSYVEVTTYDTTIFSSRNNYLFLSIPVTFGYEISKGKWQVTPEVSASANFIIAGRASWYAGEPQSMNVYSRTSRSFSPCSFTAGVALRAGYRLSDKLSLTARTGYTRFLGSILRSDNDIQLSPYSYSFTIGARYYFDVKKKWRKRSLSSYKSKRTIPTSRIVFFTSLNNYTNVKLSRCLSKDDIEIASRS